MYKFYDDNDSSFTCVFIRIFIIMYFLFNVDYWKLFIKYEIILISNLVKRSSLIYLLTFYLFHLESKFIVLIFIEKFVYSVITKWLAL